MFVQLWGFPPHILVVWDKAIRNALQGCRLIAAYYQVTGSPLFKFICETYGRNTIQLCAFLTPAALSPSQEARRRI